MATLWVTQFSAVATGGPPCATYPSLGTIAIPIPSSGQAIGAAFGNSTYNVRVISDTDCLFDIGLTPQAATPLVANIPEYFTVTPGHSAAVSLR